MQLLSNVVKYCYHHPSVEKPVFSATVHPVDLRPVCKFKFVRCGIVEKKQSTLSPLNHGGLKKFDNSFFQIANLRFSMIFADFRENKDKFKS